MSSRVRGVGIAAVCAAGATTLAAGPAFALPRGGPGAGATCTYYNQQVGRAITFYPAQFIVVNSTILYCWDDGTWHISTVGL
jgi:hypothetical protein